MSLESKYIIPVPYRLKVALLSPGGGRIQRFSLSRYFQTAFQRVCTSLYSHQQLLLLLMAVNTWYHHSLHVSHSGGAEVPFILFFSFLY
jgi:hypothetical protein